VFETWITDKGDVEITSDFDSVFEFLGRSTNHE
jgi:hypothetical protein